MAERVDPPPMITRPVCMLCEDETTGHAAIEAETDARDGNADSDDYSTESDRELRLASGRRRAAPKRNDGITPVIRPLDDIFTEAVNYKT